MLDQGNKQQEEFLHQFCIKTIHLWFEYIQARYESFSDDGFFRGVKADFFCSKIREANNLLNMKCIVGVKKEMTRLYVNGHMIPVTKIVCDPVTITQVKTKEKDGYSAIQLGYFVSRKTKKPRLGHTKGLANFRRFKEFRMISDQEPYKRGDVISCVVFEEGENVKITGKSKGRGFTGVVKRHGFSGAPQTHGNKDQLRMPGSIGSQGPQHVFKGMRMAGRYGNEQITVKNLQVIKVDPQSHAIYVKGAIPGHVNAYVFISTSQGEMDLNKVNEHVKQIQQEDKDQSMPQQAVSEPQETNDSVAKTDENVVLEAESSSAPEDTKQEKA